MIACVQYYSARKNLRGPFQEILWAQTTKNFGEFTGEGTFPL